MTLLGLTNNASAQGSYQIQIAASTNNISSIKLFTTGGAMAVATNVSNVIFPVHGTNLWAGLHPFYALVEAAAGQKYRTRTEWIRMSP
jgi:Na+-transporting NADH:ubiquinone oxidoreductase subunit NqrC